MLDVDARLLALREVVLSAYNAMQSGAADESQDEIVAVEGGFRFAMDVSIASLLFDDEASCVLSEDGLPGFLLAYELNLDAASSRALDFLVNMDCALLGDDMPLHRGVVFLSDVEDGMADPDAGEVLPLSLGMRCSRETCSCDVCPVALAACLTSYAARHPGEDILLYAPAGYRSYETAAPLFRMDWEPRLLRSEQALNLLCSMRENDFSGLVVADDDSYLDDFVFSVHALLVSLGKIDEDDSPVFKTMLSLMESVNPILGTFRFTGSENLPSRTLFVLTHVAEFVEQLQARVPAARFVMQRLSSIVDERYVLIVGSQAELSRLCSQDTKFSLVFEQNTLHLRRMPQEELYQQFLDNLDEDLHEQAYKNSEFRNKMAAFVDFNSDCLPFHGRELADYLAKYMNSSRRLKLPRSRYQSSSLDEMLESIVGLESVKQTVRDLERFAVFRKNAQAQGHELPNSNMHMLFEGNPGTGKTMVARIITTMLYKIGIIRQNKLVEATAKDLIAKYVGHTAGKTNEVIVSARGGVLFIDEAYALAPEGRRDAGFGKESVAELVKSMDDYRGDLIVILAGYEEEMEEFLQVNSGIKSRIGYSFHFDDYSTDELLRIYEAKLASAGYCLAEDGSREAAREIFSYFRRFQGFGNGRFVETMAQKTLVKFAASLDASTVGLLAPIAREDVDDSAAVGLSTDAAEDPTMGAASTGSVDFAHDIHEASSCGSVIRLRNIPSREDLMSTVGDDVADAEDMLAPYVGMKDLKREVMKFEKVMRFREQARRAGLRLPDLNLHMLFRGNPGTGKTSIARIIAKLLHACGAIPSNRLVEVEARDLAVHRPGTSELEVTRRIEKAMGGVLFVDEAYALLYDGEGAKVIAELVKAMEDRKSQLVVMFAGYADEMDEFVADNPGLASRIGYTFDFEDYKPDELEEMFERKADAAGLVLDDGAKAASREVFRYFHNVESFGNGRFVDRIIQEIIAMHAERVAGGAGDELASISADDVPSIRDVCKLVAAPVYMPADEDGGEQALRRVAIHEVGHAVCRLALTNSTDITFITVEEEGSGALGYVERKARRGAQFIASDLEAEIISCVGGMAAEQLFFSSFSAGNSSDLEQATRIASRYVATYGMSAAGFVQYIPARMQRGAKPMELNALPPEVREAISTLMQRCFEEAGRILERERAVVEDIAEELFERGTMSGEELVELWGMLRKGGDDV